MMQVRNDKQHDNGADYGGYEVKPKEKFVENIGDQLPFRQHHLLNLKIETIPFHLLA